MCAIKVRNMTSVYFLRENEILCLYRIGSKVADKMYVGAAETPVPETPEPTILPTLIPGAEFT